LDLTARTPPHYAPDFVAVTEIDTVEAAFAEAAATPLDRLRAELLGPIESGMLPERVRPLADGDPAARAALRRAMQAFHRLAIAPYADDIRAAVRADRAAR